MYFEYIKRGDKKKKKRGKIEREAKDVALR